MSLMHKTEPSQGMPHYQQLYQSLSQWYSNQ